MVAMGRFSLFTDLLKPFVGKLVVVEAEGYALSGVVRCFDQNSNVFLKNGRVGSGSRNMDHD
jgi:small nuclear ribonucleoprotein (snRNP)-like protein